MNSSSSVASKAQAAPGRVFELAKLSEAGISMARTDFSWSRIEPEDRTFPGLSVVGGMEGQICAARLTGFNPASFTAHRR